MLPELSEQDASGEIARIYAEIRETTGVPYVSSLQRHLATRPGWLEWCWAAVGPGFRSGLIPATVWQLADDLEIPALPPIEGHALALLGVDDRGAREIAGVLSSFVRVSPTNLGFSGVVRRLLLGEAAGARVPAVSGWTPPAPLAALPAMVDMGTAEPSLRALLLSLGNEVDGQPFVPGLYRMLGRWPAYLAHVATVLGPARAAAEAACATLAARIDRVAPGLQGALGSQPASPARDAAERARVLAAIDRYRVTSPQMVVYGRMLRGALP